MDKYRNLSEYCQQLALEAVNGALDNSLQCVVDVVDEITSYSSSFGHVSGSIHLDALCAKIGSLTAGSFVGRTPRNKSIVILVTGLARTGGHSRVVHDLLNAEAASERTVLVSNLRAGTHDPAAEYLVTQTGAAVETAPLDLTLSQKMVWLQERLAALRPGKTYLALHPFDAASVAAVQPSLAKRVYYLHMADHSLALGARHPAFTHVDFNDKSHHRCQGEGVVNGAMLSLAVDDPLPNLARASFTRGHLTTCTVGNFEKFDFSRLREPNRYHYGYAEGVSAILNGGGGSHIHIGTLSDQTLLEIHENMDLHGLSHDQFLHIPFVENVAKALIELAVDLYVGSFPWGGGRATVEAMSAGLPVMVHANYRSVLFSAENEVYPGAFVWKDFTELRAQLHRFNATALRRHRKMSRAFYEANHTRGRLEQALKNLWSGRRPKRRPIIDRTDPVQNFLDSHPDVIG